MITYRFAGLNDLELLVTLRLKFIEADQEDNNYGEMKSNIEHYFKTKITNGECVVVLAEHKSEVIGTGILFFFDSVPSVSNMTGKNAYITSMYVEECYRRQQIGSTLLLKLLDIAKEKNYNTVLLNATELGKKLYEKHGFVKIEHNMVCKL